MDSVKNHQSDITEPSRDSCKLFIGGLSGKTTPDVLRQYFGKFGTISECTVMKDPVTRRSRGFGFVTFASPSSVDNVLACETHEIDAKSVEAKLAVPKQSSTLIMSNQTKTSNHHSRKLFVGGLSAATTIEDIKCYFEQYGKVVDAMLLMDRLTQRHRGFAFVTFESEAVVERVIEVHYHEINNKMVECKKAKPKEELSPPPSRVGFLRRGDIASYILPNHPAASFYLHNLAGYAPTLMSAGSLQAAFLSGGIDPIAAYAASLPSSMHTLSFDSPMGASNADGSVSDLSPTTSLNAINGMDPNGHGIYSPPGYVMTSGGLLVNQSLMSLVTPPYGYVANVPQQLSVGDAMNQRPFRNGYC